MLVGALGLSVVAMAVMSIWLVHSCGIKTLMDPWQEFPLARSLFFLLCPCPASGGEGKFIHTKSGIWKSISCFQHTLFLCTVLGTFAGNKCPNLWYSKRSAHKHFPPFWEVPGFIMKVKAIRACVCVFMLVSYCAPCYVESFVWYKGRI